MKHLSLILVMAVCVYATEFKDCGSTSATVNNVEVDGQQDCSFTLPTDLKPLTVKIDFSSTSTASQVTASCEARFLGSPAVPIPLLDSNACTSGGLTCPLRAQDYTFTKEFELVPGQTPKPGLDFRWQLKDEMSNDIVCVDIPSCIGGIDDPSVVDPPTVGGSAYIDCGSRDGKILSVELEGCSKTDIPCILKENTDHKLTVKFQNLVAVEEVNAIAEVRYNLWMAKELNVPKNACDGGLDTCPLEVMKEYTYTTDLKFGAYYPNTDDQVMQLLLWKTPDIVCLQIALKIEP